VGEEVELLEHHPNLGAVARDLPLGKLDELAVGLLVADQAPVNPDPALVEPLQVVDDAQKGALAAARRPHYHHDLALGDAEADPLEHVVGTEVLVGVAHLD